jgi:acetyl-CoA carboxylase beta subunit
MSLKDLSGGYTPHASHCSETTNRLYNHDLNLHLSVCLTVSMPCRLSRNALVRYRNVLDYSILSLMGY